MLILKKKNAMEGIGGEINKFKCKSPKNFSYAARWTEPLLVSILDRFYKRVVDNLSVCHISSIADDVISGVWAARWELFGTQLRKWRNTIPFRPVVLDNRTWPSPRPLIIYCIVCPRFLPYLLQCATDLGSGWDFRSRGDQDEDAMFWYVTPLYSRRYWQTFQRRLLPT